MVKLALLRLRTLRVLAHSVLLFAAMAYSYSGKDLIGQRLALHHSPISRPFQEERDVHFATSQRPLPGLEAAQPLPTSGCQLFWCQQSLRPCTEPVQQPDARRLLVARFSPLDSAPVAVPQQRLHPVVQQSDPDQLGRYLAMLRKLNGGRRYGVEQWIQTFGRLSDEHPYGCSVLNGMVNIWPEYPHRRAFESYQTLFVGWFLKPEPFSKKQAQLPPTEDDAYMRFLPQLAAFRCLC